MKILSVNSGSSSIKYQLFELDTEKVLIQVEFKNHSEGEFEMIIGETEHKILEKDYEYSFDTFLETILDLKIINDSNEIESVVHRVVHGGEKYSKITKINEEVMLDIETFGEFAPIHNPPAARIIRLIAKSYPNFEQYAVFDTAFHLTNKKEQFLYGLPYGYYENLRVRRYGFHGISYEYILSELIKIDSKVKSQNLILCHLGSGSSVCAVQNGESFDHSFGFTPDENLIMATRSGEVDYDAVAYIKNKLMMTDEDVTKLLNQESGLLGISGYTKDMKKLIEDYSINDRAKLAVDMYVEKVVEWISKFYVSMQGCNVLVFTGGIGWRAPFLRKLILDKLEILGISFEEDKNNKAAGLENFVDLTSKSSKAKVLVLQTNEELQMLKLFKNK